MKKLLIIGLVACGLASSGMAQGVVTFKNFGTGANGAIVFGSANVFNVDGTTPLSGTGFTAELINTADSSSIGTVNFGTGALAGTFSPNTTYPVNGVAAGATANLLVRAWDNSTGATYDLATIRGESNAFDIVLGNTTTPSTYPILVGMNSFALVPEPSVIMLGLAGAGLLWFRRKK
jgi:hypothetical protein